MVMQQCSKRSLNQCRQQMLFQKLTIQHRVNSHKGVFRPKKQEAITSLDAYTDACTVQRVSGIQLLSNSGNACAAAELQAKLEAYLSMLGTWDLSIMFVSASFSMGENKLCSLQVLEMRSLLESTGRSPLNLRHNQCLWMAPFWKKGLLYLRWTSSGLQTWQPANHRPDQHLQKFHVFLPGEHNPPAFKREWRCQALEYSVDSG